MNGRSCSFPKGLSEIGRRASPIFLGSRTPWRTRGAHQLRSRQNKTSLAPSAQSSQTLRMRATLLFWLVRIWCETELSRESCFLFPLLLLQLTQSDTEFVSLGTQIGPIGLGWLFGSFMRVICHLPYSTPRASTHNHRNTGPINRLGGPPRFPCWTSKQPESSAEDQGSCRAHRPLPARLAQVSPRPEVRMYKSPSRS